MIRKILLTLSAILWVLFLFCFSYAGIINYGKPVEERWKVGLAAERAYRPNPILFCHGFASGGPLATWVEREGQKESEKPKLDEKLNFYFKNYYNPIPPTLDNPKQVAIKDYFRIPYLELISFIDFTRNWRSQLIDRNSSIDTYQTGDYYVKTGERMAWDNPILEKDTSKKPLTLGWADKLNEQIQILRKNYKDKNGKSQRITLVCHSMAGLTAREYLTNSKYSNAVNEVEKVVFIGVPNLGSQWANVATGLTNARSMGWLIPGVGWLFSSGIEVFDKIVEHNGLIDIDGDALRDMDSGERGSGFLKQLNSRSQPQGIDYFAIWGNGDSLTDVLVSRHL